MSTRTEYRFVPFQEPADGVYGYINDLAITDEVIERLNANAEAGFPGVESRPVGRPREIGDEAGVVIQFRDSPAKRRALDNLAAEQGMTRSEYLRHVTDELIAA